ncbi:MAG: Flp1 family type IVb pilin [Eubacteriales bacterium]|nr:Flp1 family type IVb pilin [Eubacteriales bacterium]
MREKMDFLWLKATSKMRNFWEDFKHEEKGAAEIVAIVLIIVIVVAVAFIFKDKIMDMVNNTMNKATDFTNETLNGNKPQNGAGNGIGGWIIRL